MVLPAIPDELLVDIFLRLPAPGDLIRASAACASFRRLVADRSFLRRFRKIHPPPLLGFLYPGQHRFHPAVRPHPSAPAASAVALAADFSFAFLPAPARNWSVREVRDGRVLLDRSRRHDSGDGLEALFKQMVVCDPLHRLYLLLPPIPDDLAASVVDQFLIEGHCFAETFLVPPGNGDEEAAAATEEEGTSFRVIWMVLLQAKLVAAVFSSGTGKWRAFSSKLLPGFVVSRHYAHGCFYWVSGSTEKLLVLDIQRMKFSMADHPPCARHSGDDVAIVEAGQGMIRMLVPKPDTSRLKYNVWRNNAGISTQWQMEKRTFSLDSGSLLTGAVGRHLLLYQCGSSLVKSGGFTLDVDTLQCERVCASLPKPSHIYCNFPPLLAAPTVSSAKPHAGVRGEGDAVRVPELREADPGGVEAHVLAAAAQAPNPLFVGSNDAEAGCGGRGGGAGAGAGAGAPEGAGAGGVAREGVQGGEGPAGTRVSRRTTAAKGNKSFSWRGCLPFWM
ncbi:uncharacterized protein LOC119366335 [Triticum dicoccoides]|uniref:uncharacterized protein LOC119366335 n=1 Tax=Triticum dicoccoides TaxID=85692 RepID=UPI00188F406C|nr:uncharacterized protein LOC119366335 [Triticum dicoccoides]XP_037487957.1 uncharacterized protein LOC119366335 [Triticum dicoccoides]